MTELEQINEKLDKILALLQPKKELNASNSLDEVRSIDEEKKPEKTDFKLDSNHFVDGWDYIHLKDRLGFTTEKRILKHSKNGRKINNYLINNN